MTLLKCPILAQSSQEHNVLGTIRLQNFWETLFDLPMIENTGMIGSPWVG